MPIGNTTCSNVTGTSSMPGALRGALLKIERAEGHLESLAESVRAFLDSGAYGETAKFYKDAELTRIVGRPGIGPIRTGERFYVGLHFQEKRKAPDSWSTIIGDFLHNTRSALDHLAFALAGSDRAVRTEFPICFTEEKFVEQIKRKRLKGVSPKAVRIIKWVQPYHSGLNAAKSHPLYILHQLSRIDKHQTLHIAGAAMFDTGIDVFGIDGAEFRAAEVRRQGPIEHDSVFAVLTFDVPQLTVRRHPDPMGVHHIHIKAQMPSKKALVFDIAGPANGGEVLSTLTTLLECVRDRIVPAFCRFFR